ncbi:zinc-binding dehydrogenase [Phlyctema vagabunda]|uniref:Zinc-binding dehydrogenase n=1 Tax=Phlyctema vagabunda TaxID=108571 RepID=A0ABR4PXJ0_9HELO
MEKMNALMTRFLRSPCLSTIAIPTPSPSELLIKVAYVSLNPTDCESIPALTWLTRWDELSNVNSCKDKHASAVLPPSKVIGCDFSGTVTKIGRSVSPLAFKEGDRVSGIIHGCKNTHTGAFAEHLVADSKLCFKLPDKISLEKGCTFGVGWLSSLQALGQRLFLEEGNKETEDTLLIYSAATNMGMHAIQQTRAYYPTTHIIAIASEQHHLMLKQLGAHETFDYKSSTLVDEIRALRRDIKKGIDCHSEGSSTSIAAQCMLPPSGDDLENSGRRLIRTLPPAMGRGSVPKSVRADEWILTYTALGKPFWFFFRYYVIVPEDYTASQKCLHDLTALLEEERVVPVRHRLMSGGLAEISDGFEEMRKGLVRGEKLVYRIGGEV